MSVATLARHIFRTGLVFTVAAIAVAVAGCITHGGAPYAYGCALLVTIGATLVLATHGEATFQPE